LTKMANRTNTFIHPVLRLTHHSANQTGPPFPIMS
jgi:hypothetical protein